MKILAPLEFDRFLPPNKCSFIALNWSSLLS
uniref:Uncharacterized protein n=1 Tax=Anguilla anguilla TaxID=7936 RepID=A0A0E9UBA8_ANGAN